MEDPKDLLPRPTTYMFWGGNNMMSTAGSTDIGNRDEGSPATGVLVQVPADTEASSNDGSPSTDKAPFAKGMPGGRWKRPRSWSSTRSRLTSSGKPVNMDGSSQLLASGGIDSSDCCGGGSARYDGKNVKHTRGDQLADDGRSQVYGEASVDEAVRGEEKNSNGPLGIEGPSFRPIVADGAGHTPIRGQQEEGSTAVDRPTGRDEVSHVKGEGRQCTNNGRGEDDDNNGSRPCAQNEGESYTRQEHQAVGVVVHEVLSEDFGLFTWPCGVVLACLVWSRRQEFVGASVVEIGAGTALPGLLAAKLGASVVLTDREEAPWVLQNMRGAVEANGFSPGTLVKTRLATTTALGAADAATIADASAAAGVAGSSTSVTTAAADDDADGVAAEAGGEFLSEGKEKAEQTGDSERVGRNAEKINLAAAAAASAPRDKKEIGTRDLCTGVSAPLGKCSVQGLSWGNIGPAAIKLARERRPQVVLGADVFYSSEHFDSVLATVFMLLSGAGGCGRAVADNAGAASPHTPPGVGYGLQTASSPSASGTTSPADAATASATTGDHATIAGAIAPSSAADGGMNAGHRFVSSPANTAAPVFGNPFSPSNGVFLTAYQERSARRSIRPLLRKWGMKARVLHDAPQQVLPPALWESGRYDSVALLEISLL